ncbi:putative ABC transport system permease protein [Austwickia chelonae]|uniref:ABC3 transporter permease C-terminal domain-containing protein n=1 Tax=Austwickia chelonae NBRC 105200 TaxID=1184607 RepID=K6VP73_9MICO|nr:FtsX-like permease family protein [Austwickia chelonae]GAB78494.1 hypothetical protein AUCHE_09_00990 [Austwickia chelonae NBRC 105200]SEW40129.1 putative ABC transport system permease protein [Austwickia chelonae]
MKRRAPVIDSPLELGSVGIIAALMGFYATLLVMFSATAVAATPEHSRVSMAVMLSTITAVLVMTAVYVASVVISHCVDTVLAGRLTHIALLRTLGARPRQIRTSVMGTTTVTAGLCAILGTILGMGFFRAGILWLIEEKKIPELDYPWFSGYLLITVATIGIAAAVASWSGTRVVLSVPPAIALSSTKAPTPLTPQASRTRAILTWTLLTSGLAGMAAGMAMGERRAEMGVLAAFFGSTLLMTGLLTGGRFVVPLAISALGRLLGDDPTARIARRNAVKDPVRTTRSTMGMILGVSLVVTFAVASETAKVVVLHIQDRVEPWQRDSLIRILDVFQAVMVGLVLVSFVVAAVGFVATMTMTIIQRRREIGLLRATGFTPAQIKAMITREAVALGIGAISTGVLLGTFFGVAAVQSLMGSFYSGIPLGVPWSLLGALVVCSAGLVLVASRAPARRAVQVPVVDALRES